MLKISENWLARNLVVPGGGHGHAGLAPETYSIRFDSGFFFLPLSAMSLSEMPSESSSSTKRRRTTTPPSPSSSSEFTFDRLPPDVILSHIFSRFRVIILHETEGGKNDPAWRIDFGRWRHGQRERLPILQQPPTPISLVCQLGFGDRIELELGTCSSKLIEYSRGVYARDWNESVPLTSVSGLFGRFVRDPMRHPWFLYRVLDFGDLLHPLAIPLVLRTIVIRAKSLHSLTVPEGLLPHVPTFLPNLECLRVILYRCFGEEEQWVGNHWRNTPDSSISFDSLFCDEERFQSLARLRSFKWHQLGNATTAPQEILVPEEEEMEKDDFVGRPSNSKIASGLTRLVSVVISVAYTPSVAKAALALIRRNETSLRVLSLHLRIGSDLFELQLGQILPVLDANLARVEMLSATHLEIGEETCIPSLRYVDLHQCRILTTDMGEGATLTVDRCQFVEDPFPFWSPRSLNYTASGGQISLSSWNVENLVSLQFCCSNGLLVVDVPAFPLLAEFLVEGPMFGGTLTIDCTQTAGPHFPAVTVLDSQKLVDFRCDSRDFPALEDLSVSDDSGELEIVPEMVENFLSLPTLNTLCFCISPMLLEFRNDHLTRMVLSADFGPRNVVVEKILSRDFEAEDLFPSLTTLVLQPVLGLPMRLGISQVVMDFFMSEITEDEGSSDRNPLVCRSLSLIQLSDAVRYAVVLQWEKKKGGEILIQGFNQRRLGGESEFWTLRSGGDRSNWKLKPLAELLSSRGLVVNVAKPVRVAVGLF